MHYHLPQPISFGTHPRTGSSNLVSWTGSPSQSLPEPGSDLSLCRTCMRTCDDTIRRVGAIYSFRASDLDDFMQDAWLAVLNAVAGGRCDPRRGRLVDWLFVVARNRAVTLFRRRCRAQSSVVEVPLDLLQCRQSEDPATILDRSCDIERVRQAVEMLEQRISPLNYAVFHLRQIQQRSVDEVAAVLALTHEQVRVYDYRARRKLASMLARHEFA